MNEPNSLEKRIELTETLISFLSKDFFLKLKSNLEEWPRTYEFTYLEKSYKAVFSVFGSFTLIPNDIKQTAGSSPIYYLSLCDDAYQRLVWTKPDGEIADDPKQIFEELKQYIRIFETSISKIDPREEQI
ncbi:hypothetical protein QMM42_09420 [Leptospira santarosai]|uniref:Uncharacterized protein n=1 Tax=Leptospira santarosai serovar Arenal str. MAVJ 401 TaxID=1049976 RepID=M6JIU0_9LEPT|nr:hypothetical protein [Leptospira santarosai]EMM75301.1 hypothetical protein LEP1GSC040_3225 [Leptospira santarosai str. 2000030832]EMN19480.1 hypothetical protein LEP1GSC063_1560 [Leptospira santarosai serovar Arenal str. MAVJ 401]MDI7186419.1 hypothetical protein [Leptospira santarosai]MDI7195850.1 hypothetical protein [Leptospira santarosai]MDI7198929.1 hypothetical protein [Leptospira santarosai]